MRSIRKPVALFGESLAVALLAVAIARPSAAAQAESQFRCMAKIEQSREALARRAGDSALEIGLARRLAGCGDNIEAAAWYRSIVRADPGDMAAWYALGAAEAWSGRWAASARAFSRMLAIAPGNAGADLGLAHADARIGQWDAALVLYEQVLAKTPGNHDALEGKAFLLYWSGRWAEARALFAGLCRANPADHEGCGALASVTRAMDAARWTAWRPRSNAPAQAWMGYEISYLADHPSDEAALRRLAAAEAQLGLYQRAVRDDQRALRLAPKDSEAQQHMARVLAWSRQYPAAIEADDELLRSHPEDRQALEHLAQTDLWAGRLTGALAANQALLGRDPGSTAEELRIARLEWRLKGEEAASKMLSDLLHQQPSDRAARLDRAQIEMHEGRLPEALIDYNAVLDDNFADSDACFGAARIYFYLGEPERAEPLALRAARERPGNADFLTLAARIELALHHRKQARALIRSASRLAPSSDGVRELEGRMRSEPRVTVETQSSYAREIAVQNPLAETRGAYLPARTIEDLNSYGSSVRTSFSFLPQSNSYVLLAASPSNSPFGGIQGTVAPAELMYGQTTRLASWATLRGGFGIARLGPGELPTHNPPTDPVQAISTRGLTGVGYAGYSLFPTRAFGFDLTASRQINAATPVSVRLGAIETRLSARLHYALNQRTHVRASFDHIVDAAPLFYDADDPGPLALFVHGRDVGNEGRIVFDRSLIQTERFSLDAGYAGLAFGFKGADRGTWMGFFNPIFYQQQFATIRLSDKLFGPVGFTFDGGAGVQRIGSGEPFTRGSKIHPALSLRLTRTFGLTVGYTHYDFSQALGAVRGNAVELTTNWSF